MTRPPSSVGTDMEASLTRSWGMKKISGVLKQQLNRKGDTSNTYSCLDLNLAFA